MVSQTPISMSEEQQNFLEENGYAGPFSIDDTVHLSTLKTSLKQANRTFIDKIENLLKHRNAHLKFRLVYDIATLSCIKDNVSKVLGDDLLLWIGHVLCRPPGDNGREWHLDQTNKDVNGLHVSVAASDMTLENGCMHVIPKTHKYGEITNPYLYEQAKLGNIDNNDVHSMLAFADRLHPEDAPHQVVPIQLKSSQYCFTKGGLWHGVTPNTSNETRIVLVARYMRPQESKVMRGKQDSLKCIVVRGKDLTRNQQLIAPPLPLFKRNLLFSYNLNRFYSNSLGRLLTF